MSDPASCLTSAPGSPAVLVLDTNVVLDCLVFDDPATRTLWQALRDGEVVCAACAETLLELQIVLAYPALKLSAARQAQCYADYTALARDVQLDAVDTLPRCRDPDDQKFLQLAALSGASRLVSKDHHLLKLKGRTRLAFAIVPPARWQTG